jgi:hypothetical protein
MKIYIEELLTIFSGFYQTIFSFLMAHRLQQLFPQLTAHSNFFHSHSPTKQTLNHLSRKKKFPDHDQCYLPFAHMGLSNHRPYEALFVSRLSHMNYRRLGG